jgi:hypothetical protein
MIVARCVRYNALNYTALNSKMKNLIHVNRGTPKRVRQVDAYVRRGPVSA